MGRSETYSLKGAVRHNEVGRLIDLYLRSLGISAAAATTVSIIDRSGRRRSTSTYSLGVGRLMLLVLRSGLMTEVVMMLLLV